MSLHRPTATLTALAFLVVAPPIAAAAEPGAGEPAASAPAATAAASSAPSAAAGSQGNVEKAQVEPDSSEHLRGLEIMLRPTFGGAGGKSPLHAAPGLGGTIPPVFDGVSSPYGAGFGIGAELGFRFHPIVSAGLRGYIESLSATAPDATVKDISRSRKSAGLYLRGYPLSLSGKIRRYIDPWIATGVTYINDRQSFQAPASVTDGRTIRTVDASYQVEHHAIGVPLGIGIDYRLTRAVSLGPSFEYTFVTGLGGCVKATAAGMAEGKFCTDNDGPTKAAAVADSFGSWTLGLNLRLTPF